MNLSDLDPRRWVRKKEDEILLKIENKIKLGTIETSLKYIELLEEIVSGFKEKLLEEKAELEGMNGRGKEI